MQRIEEMKRILIYICAIINIFLLSGCFGNEPNDTAYVVALGIDSAQSGTFNITIQFAKPTQISGGGDEKGGDGSDVVENITVEAPDIYSALNTANHIISKKFSLAHAKIVVFSGDMAKNGIRSVIESLARNDEIRPDLITAVSRETAAQYLQNAKPLVELNPAKYYQLIYEENESGGVPKKTGLETIFEISGERRDTVMPLSGVAKATENLKDKQEEAPENDQGFQYKTKDYKAGEVKLLEEDKSEVLGMAVFRGDKLVAELGETEADIYNILTGNYKDSYTSFYSPKAPDEAVTVRLNQRRKPIYKVDKKNKKVKVKLYIEGNLYSMPYNYDLNSEIEEFEMYAAEEISKKSVDFIKDVRDNYGSDILGIGEKIRKDFLDLKSFEEYDWEKMFKEYDIEVETKFKIRHSGIIYRREQWHQF